MSALHEVLSTRREEIMLRWKAQVHGTLAPVSMLPVELIDHLPVFLREVIAALAEDAGEPPIGPALEDSPTAASHGEQRLRLGFSLDAVVREYGVLRDAIVVVAGEAGAAISVREMQVIFNATITGIAHAVSEYSRQRDAELLRQANEHFAFIAHELRNPLSSAMMGFTLLKEGRHLPSEGRAVGALERGLLRLRDVIEHSLRVARMASGIELRRQAGSFKALLEEAEVGAGSMAEAKGIQLRMHLEKDEIVHVDFRLVRSALDNLVRNAVKYTPAGGAVEVRGTVSEGRATVEVEDCCGGLPPGKVEEAFAPFVRIDSHQSGFGLGLAIAKQAADAHGGSIRVQNLPGKGCIFVLELPTNVDHAPGRTRPPTALV